MKKIFFIITLTIFITFILTGCSLSSSVNINDNNNSSKTKPPAVTSSNNQNDSIIKNREEFEKLLTNYSCEIHVIDNENTSVLMYKVHPEGMVYQTDNNDYIIYDSVNKKLYILDSEQKVGMSMDYAEGSNFALPSSYFLAWGSVDLSMMMKGSPSTIDNRSVIEYTFKDTSSEVKYYIDTEMGFCVACEVKSGDEIKSRWEMKNLKIGNVSKEDISVPEDYTIMGM